ncbi:MAG: hypothetical protein K0Q43_1856 [Ramlibacter sp.]|jgi:hypothetical protein|nr:hypothetical protein [Ramlibacter sp.]
MAEIGFPSWDDWMKLQRILGDIELIVSDANVYHTPSDLLGLGAGPQAVGKQSKLATALASQASSTPYSAEWLGGGAVGAYPQLGFEAESAAALLKILPGCDALGDDEIGRVRALRARLKELPAFRWLTESIGYREAAHVLFSLERAKGGNFEEADIELKLARVLAGPLSTYQLCANHPEVALHPDRKAVQAALKQAIALQGFFQQHPALRITEGTPWNLTESLPRIVDALKSMERSGYKRPPDDLVRLRTHLTDELIRGVHNALGECRAALLQPLLSLFEYYPGTSNLEKRIKICLG